MTLARPAWLLAPGVRRLEANRVVIGGSPTTIMRLTGAGAEVLDRALTEPGQIADAAQDPADAAQDPADGARDTPGAAGRALLARLEQRGMLVATPAPLPPGSVRSLLERLTVVVPVRDDAEGLAELLDSLAAALDSETPVGSAGPTGSKLPSAAAERGRPQPRFIVVDDGSAEPDSLAVVAQRFGARLIRRSHSGGPGVARTTGLDAVTTPLVAFLDADVTVTPDWLATVGAHFNQHASASDLALVAPRVAARSGVPPETASLRAHNMAAPRLGLRTAATEAIERYERQHSSLDLGPVGGAIAAGTRLAYAPSAAWVARADALRSVGGFDPNLRYGEDVDLIWRLVAAGWTARYEPRSDVRHRVRPTARAWVEQRFRYGTSAGPLAVRHPKALAPVVVSPWSAAAWALAALGHPVAGAAVAAGSTAALARRLKVADPAVEAIRLAGRGTLLAGPQLARGLIRPWWPVTIVIATRWRRGRWLAGGALAASAARGASGSGAARELAGPALAIADDLAYGAGVWRGVANELRHRPSTAGDALGALLPRIGGIGPGGRVAKRLRSTTEQGERPVGADETDETDEPTEQDRAKAKAKTKAKAKDQAKTRGADDSRRSGKSTEQDGGGSW